MTLRALTLLLVMGGLFAFIGSFFGTIGGAFALTGAIMISFWSYWSAGPDLIARTGAVACRDRTILELIERLAGRAGVPVPRVFIVDDVQPNALTIGPNPSQSILVLTSAMCLQLSGHELEAVIAHEIAHIRNRDVLASTFATTFTQAILSLAALLGLLALLLDRKARAAVLVLAVVMPFTAALLRCLLSRSAEYRADRDAALLCGTPAPLISALHRLHRISYRRPSRVASFNPATAALFIVDPLPSSWFDMFKPHPPIHCRIERLQQMMDHL